MGLYFFVSAQPQVRLGSSTLVHREGGAKSVRRCLVEPRRSRARDAGSHQAGRSRQWWWGGETPKHWQGAASCCDWCSRVSQLFLRGSVICVFLFKYQVLCLNVFHVLWLTLALYFLHVSLQSNKFVLESITVIYIPIFMRFMYAYSMCTIWWQTATKSGCFDWDLSAFIVGFGLEAIHGFRFVVRTWTEASRLHLAGTTCARSPSNCFRGHDQ